MAKTPQSKSKNSTKNGKSDAASTEKKNGTTKKNGAKKVLDLEEENLSDEDSSFETNGNGHNDENGEATGTGGGRLLDECHESFANKDLYSIFNIDKKTATQAESKSVVNFEIWVDLFGGLIKYGGCVEGKINFVFRNFFLRKKAAGVN